MRNGLRNKSIVGRVQGGRLRVGMAVVALVMVWSTVMLSSCKSNDTGSMVPNDSYFVANANVASMWDKAEMDKADNLTFLKLIRQELKGENAGLSQMLDNLLKDPNSCGLNIKSDIVAFMTPSIGNKNLVLCAAMKDAGDFESFLKELSEKTEMPLDIEKESGYYRATIASEATICWDKKKAYAIGGKVAKEQCDNIMSLKKESSMADNKNFGKFWKDRGDMSVYFEYQNLKSLSPDIELPVDDAAYKDAAFYYSTYFEKGAIRTYCKSLGVDKNEAGKFVGDKFASDLTNYMPQNALAAISLSYSIDGLMNILANVAKVDMNEEIGIGDFTFKDLIGSFGGSLIGAISDFDDEGMPVFAVAADLTQKSILKDVLGECVDGGMFEKKTDYYHFKFVNIDIAMNDNHLLVTNDQGLRTAFGTGGAKGALSNVDKDINKGNYVYIDLDLNKYPKSITGKLNSSVVALLGGYFDRLVFSPKGDDAGEVVIYLKDTQQNSLAFTIHYIDDNLLQIGNLADNLI